jgi:hypothetical protein
MALVSWEGLAFTGSVARLLIMLESVKVDFIMYLFIEEKLGERIERIGSREEERGQYTNGTIGKAKLGR